MHTRVCLMHNTIVVGENRENCTQNDVEHLKSVFFCFSLKSNNPNEQYIPLPKYVQFFITPWLYYKVFILYSAKYKSNTKSFFCINVNVITCIGNEYIHYYLCFLWPFLQ